MKPLFRLLAKEDGRFYFQLGGLIDVDHPHHVPGPQRGELIRLFGEELRANKDALGRLVTLEAGKILQEGLGEV